MFILDSRVTHTKNLAATEMAREARRNSECGVQKSGIRPECC